MIDTSELQVFFDESDELLAQMESALLSCEKTAATPEVINGIFRAAHTIKGSAGMFGLDAIVSFVHEAETVLDRVRMGTAVLDAQLVVALLACGDHVRTMVARLKQGHLENDSATQAAGDALVGRLRGGVDSTASAAGAAPGAESHAAAATPSAPSGERAACDDWHVSVRFGADTFRNGMDPMSFLRYLATFGELTRVVTRTDALDASEWDPESCFLGFDLRIQTDAPRARIVEAFDFVREDCRLEVLEPRSPLAAYVEAIRRVDGDAADPAPLIEVGTLTAAELASALAAPAARAEVPESASATGSPGATATAAREATTTDKPAPVPVAGEARSIRIDAAKLDTLINLVGELIICAAGTQLGARRSRDAELQESASQLATLVEQVRDSALQLRMVRIGATFSRCHRIVNDTARELGKTIRLTISGEDTELDKTVVEKIGDPLTHLIRNAVDHGIGPADRRIAAGKPAEGTVSLNAYHDSGHIVIEVGDDGKGLDRERILAKAIERGLVPAGAQLTEAEIDQLIFEPGFSTAATVTSVSGRGVGMDVVRRNIEALRGSVEVRSVKGVGTTFVIRLPLTLAIINGFQVAVGKSVFVLPLEMVDECIEYSAESEHDFANVRGKALPFVRLHEVLQIQRRDNARQNIVVVNNGGQRAGIVVDGLLGECQTVIKPLSKSLGRAPCISGSSILGNGEVALILDIPALVQFASVRGDKSPVSLLPPAPSAGMAQLQR